MIYRQGLRLVEAIEKLKQVQDTVPEVGLFVDVLENTKRGIIR